MAREREGRIPSLIDRVGVNESLLLDPSSESAWIEVIQKMDEVYADLVQSQTQLERQNARLEEAYAFIGSVLAAMSAPLLVLMLNQPQPIFLATLFIAALIVWRHRSNIKRLMDGSEDRFKA